MLNKSLVIFAYNRPDHLQNCLNSLFSNSEAKLSKFYVIIDGPKNEYDKIIQAKIVNLLVKIKATSVITVELLGLVIADFTFNF